VVKGRNKKPRHGSSQLPLKATFHCTGREIQYINKRKREPPDTNAVKQPELFDRISFSPFRERLW
jgi:hypothetical protein